MSKNISVLIADDHPIFRQGLREVIAGATGIDVIAEAENGAVAFEQIRSQAPDVAVLDAHMSGGSGLEAARKIQAEALPTKAVFLTMYQDEEMFNAALDAGIQGYVLKDSAISEIVDCVRAVATGRPYITHALTPYLMNRLRRAEGGQRAPLQQLTPTERRILRYIADYKTSKEIASEMGIHARTVDNHRTNMAAKLNLQGSHGLLKFALENKSKWL